MCGIKGCVFSEKLYDNKIHLLFTGKLIKHKHLTITYYSVLFLLVYKLVNKPNHATFFVPLMQGYSTYVQQGPVREHLLMQRSGRSQ